MSATFHGEMSKTCHGEMSTTFDGKISTTFHGEMDTTFHGEMSTTIHGEISTIFHGIMTHSQQNYNDFCDRSIINFLACKINTVTKRDLVSSINCQGRFF